MRIYFLWVCPLRGRKMSKYGTALTVINTMMSVCKTILCCQVSDSIDIKSNGIFDGENSIHNEAISALAELTAAAIELYYKLGEMLMIDTQNKQTTIKSENLSL